MECPNKRAGVDAKLDALPHRRGVLGFLALAASMLGFSSLARAVEKLGMVDVDYQHSQKGKQRCPTIAGSGTRRTIVFRSRARSAHPAGVGSGDRNTSRNTPRSTPTAS